MTFHFGLYFVQSVYMEDNIAKGFHSNLNKSNSGDETMTLVSLSLFKKLPSTIMKSIREREEHHVLLKNNM